MEIANLLIDRRHADAHFVLLSCGAWLAASQLTNRNHSLDPATLVFIALATGMAYVIMKLLSASDPFELSFNQLRVVLRTFAAITGAYVALELFRSVTGRIASVEELFLLGIPLLLFLFAGCDLFTLILLRTTRKRRVALVLTQREQSLLREDFSRTGLSQFMEFISRTELNEHDQRGQLHEIDLIIISRALVRSFDSDTVLLRAHLRGLPIIDSADVCSKLAGRIRLDQTDFSTYLLGATQKTFGRRLLLMFKYALERIAALVAGVLLLPLFALIAVAIKASSPGPAFYWQTRTGYMGRQFQLVKFRSMRIDAEKSGPRWAAERDDRVTPLGQLLRRTRLDELPQLWNVIRGEMRFVGPRPERPEIYAELADAVPLFFLRTLVPPGITGWAQVCAGYAASTAESHLKLEYDLFYIQHMTVKFDICIILKTIKTVFVGDGAARRRHIENAPMPIQS